VTTKLLTRRIRQRRKALGLTQEEAAERMGTATRHFQKIEAGELKNITLKTLCRLADTLRIAPGTLLAKE
jgi:transcriptional regulator with XRE-family HTH domain